MLLLFDINSPITPSVIVFILVLSCITLVTGGILTIMYNIYNPIIILSVVLGTPLGIVIVRIFTDAMLIKFLIHDELVWQRQRFGHLDARENPTPEGDDNTPKPHVN